MRTTSIPDAMYRRLKARAASEGKTTKALILGGVEHILAGETSSAGGGLSCPWCGRSVLAAMRMDNARIYEIISFP